MPTKARRTPFIPIDERVPATVRAVILARKSSSGTAKARAGAFLTGVDEDVQAQVEECRQFIARMGWTLVADPYRYSEKGKSGYFNVERPMLDAVLQLAQRGEVDVIVARELERVARAKARRYLAIGTAEKFGAEFRFANLPPDGRLPTDGEGRLYLAIADEFGQMERDRIVERTTPGRERRLAAGLPGSGCAGPPFGYRWRPKADGAKTYHGYSEDPVQSAILRELFTRIATDDTASARSLARELTTRGVSTPRGAGGWRSNVLISILRNPVYCGRGRTKRFQSAMQREQDDDTGEVHDHRKVTDRLRRTPDTYLDDTYPLAAGAVPLLIEPELWDRAQQALHSNKHYYGKLGRAASPHFENDTMLHGGLAVCARCGGGMARRWRTKSGTPEDRCCKRTTQPTHACPVHNIPAKIVDAITLRTVARALTDPEELVALADAAEAQSARAAAEVERAETTLAVCGELETELEKTRDGYLSAIAVLSAIPGNDATIMDLRVKLAHLDRDHAQAQAARVQALPAQVRAQRRQQFLDRLSHFRNAGGTINFATGEVTRRAGSGERVLYKTLDLDAAADMLGMTEAEVMATGIPLQVGWLVEDPDAAPEGVPLASVAMADALYLLLTRAPHDRVRRLLRDLGVQVAIAPPRTKAERARLGGGFTPAAERVPLSSWLSMKSRLRYVPKAETPAP